MDYYNRIHKRTDIATCHKTKLNIKTMCTIIKENDISKCVPPIKLEVQFVTYKYIVERRP